MKKSTKTWIVVVVIFLLLMIGIAIYASSSSGQSFTGTPTPINNYNLSPQDLATYNSLPNDAAKQDFLNILIGQGKATPKPNVINNTNPSTSNSNTGTTSSNQNLTIGQQIKNFFKNLFGHKITYTQTPPIDADGYDAFGCNAQGKEIDGTSCI